jgi:hypothetical protein
MRFVFISIMRIKQLIYSPFNFTQNKINNSEMYVTFSPAPQSIYRSIFILL